MRKHTLPPFVLLATTMLQSKQCMVKLSGCMVQSRVCGLNQVSVNYSTLHSHKSYCKPEWQWSSSSLFSMNRRLTSRMVGMAGWAGCPCNLVRSLLQWPLFQWVCQWLLLSGPFKVIWTICWGNPVKIEVVWNIICNVEQSLSVINKWNVH